MNDTVARVLRTALRFVGKASAALRARRRWLLLAGLLLLLAAYKVPLSQHTFSTGVDGGYYASVAQFVRDGEGLRTNVSLLHQGMPHFPHPTTVYPAWPLLWGTIAKFFPLLQSGVWLATLLYFVALVCAYGWGSSLLPAPLFPRAFPHFDAGHVLVLMLGLNGMFFRFTSQPYTEGLSFAVLFGVLWRAHALFPRPSWRSGAELGALCALAILCRQQLSLIALAAVPVLGAAALLIPVRRKDYAIMLAASVVAATLVLLPYCLWLRSALGRFELAYLLRFDAVRFSDALTPFRTVRPMNNWRAALADVGDGFELAFSLDPKRSYRAHFYTFQWAPFALLPLAVIAGIRCLWRHGIRAAWQWLCTPERVNAAFVAVLATGAVASIHVMHKTSGAWYFGFRQSLPTIILLFPCLALLLSWRRFPGRLIGVLLLVSGVYFGWQEVSRQTEKHARDKERPYHPQLVHWLDAERNRRGSLTVAMRQPQVIARHAQYVGFHWYDNQAKGDDFRAMVTKLGVDYVLVGGRNRPRYFKTDAFEEDFEEVTTQSGYKIYAPRAWLREQRKE